MPGVQLDACRASSHTHPGPALLLPPPLPLPPLYNQCSMMVAEPSSPQLDQLLQPHPTISNWMQRVRHAVGHGVYDEAHSKLRAAVHRLGAGAGKGGAAGGGGASKL